MKFHDGTPMTTADVIFSLKRNQNPELLLGFAFINVKSVEQTGAWEVTVQMKRARRDFPGLMATPAGGVGPEAYVKAKGKNYGTPSRRAGRHRAVQVHRAGTRARTSPSARNDAYWDSAHAPKTKAIQFSFIPEESTMTTGLLSGEIDGAYHTPYSGLSQLSRRRPGSSTWARACSSPSSTSTPRRGRWRTSTFASALLMAVDRKALAQTVYNGAATPLPNTQLPLAQWGYARAQAAAA